MYAACRGQIATRRQCRQRLVVIIVAALMVLSQGVGRAQGLQIETPTPQPERPQTVSILETIAEVGQAITRLSRLDPAADISCSVRGASRYAGSPRPDQPQALLFDRITTDQGIFGSPDSPLVINIEFVSRQRIQSIQLIYAGQWDDPGVSAVEVAVIEKEDELRVVGTMPAIPTAPATQPIIQQINFHDGNASRDGQWRRMRLTIGALPPELGLVEMRVIGYDEGLRGIGTGLNQIARDPAAISVGNISNIAVAIRSRRLSAAKTADQHLAVQRLSRIVSLLSGVFFELLIDAPAEGDRPADTRFRIDNTSSKPLDQSILKLRLPPGWRAAPGRQTVGEIPAGGCIFLPTSIYPVATDELPTACLYGGYDGEPLFLMADIVGAFLK